MCPKLWVGGCLLLEFRTSTFRTNLIPAARITYYWPFWCVKLSDESRSLLRLPTKMLIKLHWFDEIITHTIELIECGRFSWLLHLFEQTRNVIKIYRLYWHSANAFRISHRSSVANIIRSTDFTIIITYYEENRFLALILPSSSFSKVAILIYDLYLSYWIRASEKL